MAEKMRQAPQLHIEAAAKASPSFAAKINLNPPKNLYVDEPKGKPAIGGGGKISWAVKKGVP